jgi:cysteine-rich repeat protein
VTDAGSQVSTSDEESGEHKCICAPEDDGGQTMQRDARPAEEHTSSGGASADGALPNDASAENSSPADAGYDGSIVTATCGNGIIEQGEECDGNCPTECMDSDSDLCTKSVLKGQGCSRVCVSEKITEKAGDFCCVPGEKYSDDRYCPCGNGYYDPPEECDDYNSDFGDGCTPDCKLEDLNGTPGDDRLYISCGDQSCPVGHQCVVLQDGHAPYTCVFQGAATTADAQYSECDGPEDCFPTATCASLYRDPIYMSKQHILKCEPNSEIRRLGRSGWNIHCHVDDDCPIGETCGVDPFFPKYGMCSGTHV